MANASSESRLPYFRGKGQVEEILQDMGIPYAIIRPTLVFGEGDLLLNNMAWSLRRFPEFPVFGKGDYQIQPIYAEDPAAQAVEAGSGRDSFVAYAAGPETFTFEELVRLLASAVGGPSGWCTRRRRWGHVTGLAVPHGQQPVPKLPTLGLRQTASWCQACGAGGPDLHPGLPP